MPHCSTQRATSLIVNVNSDSSYRRGGQEGQTWADVYFHLQRAFLVPNLQEFLVHGLTGLDVQFSSPQKNKLRPHEIFFDLARTDMKPKLGVLATDTRTTTRGHVNILFLLFSVQTKSSLSTTDRQGGSSKLRYSPTYPHWMVVD
jgi:hypothetical protein